MSQRSRLISTPVLVFLVGMAFAEASLTMTMVQIPIYLKELGADIRDIGLFFTVAMIFPLALRIIGGWLADSIGRLRSITIGSLAGVLTFLAYGLAPTWQVALLAPFLMAVTRAMTIPAYYAFIGDQTRDDNRGRVFGIAETVRELAFIIGPPIGGALAQWTNYRLMFAVAAGAQACAALIFLLLYRSKKPIDQSVASRPQLHTLGRSLRELGLLAIGGGLVTWILIVDGVRDIAFKLSFDLMPIYLSDFALLGKQQIGLLDGIFGVALALSIYPAGWLVDRTSERLAIVAGLILMIASRLSFAFAMSFWGFAFSWILLGSGGGMIDPAGGALIAKSVPRRLRGLTYGLFASSLGLFSLPAPWIGSQIWTWIHPRAPFILTALLGMLVVIPAWKKLVPGPRQEDQDSPDGLDRSTSIAHVDGRAVQSKIPIKSSSGLQSLIQELSVAEASPGQAIAGSLLLASRSEVESNQALHDLAHRFHGLIFETPQDRTLICFGLGTTPETAYNPAQQAVETALFWMSQFKQNGALDQPAAGIVSGPILFLPEGLTPPDEKRRGLNLHPGFLLKTSLPEGRLFAEELLFAADSLRRYAQQQDTAHLLVDFETYTWLGAQQSGLRFGRQGEVKLTRGGERGSMVEILGWKV